MINEQIAVFDWLNIDRNSKAMIAKGGQKTKFSDRVILECPFIGKKPILKTKNFLLPRKMAKNVGYKMSMPGNKHSENMLKNFAVKL